jgi:L-arabinose isomerase
MGNRFRLLVNEVEAVEPKQELPKLPVARVLWKPYPSLRKGCEAWILVRRRPPYLFQPEPIGAGQLQDFAEMAGIEFVLIGNTHDFFLAEGSLTWWAIGASLIASNISAEQFIGMSGNGFSASASP